MLLYVKELLFFFYFQYYEIAEAACCSRYEMWQEQDLA
jgi:hypothetical protein